MVKGLRRPRLDCTILQRELRDTIFEHCRGCKNEIRLPGRADKSHAHGVKGTSGTGAVAIAIAVRAYSSRLPCYHYHAL